MANLPPFKVGDRVQFGSYVGTVVAEFPNPADPSFAPHDYDGGYWFTAVLWDGETIINKEFSDTLKIKITGMTANIIGFETDTCYSSFPGIEKEDELLESLKKRHGREYVFYIKNNEIYYHPHGQKLKFEKY